MKQLIVFFVGIAMASQLMAQGLPAQQHIMISGSGFVERMPDYAVINLSVHKTSKTLKSSKDHVDIITQQVLDAALAVGVAPDDIIASKIYAQPDYQWNDGERIYLGESVTRSLSLVLRDLSQYSTLVHAVIGAGITQLAGIELKFDDRSAIAREAMVLAIANAKQQAELIASQFAVELGTVYKISEAAIDDRSYSRSQHYAMVAQASSSNERAALKISKQRVDESVFVVFLLKPS